MEGDADTIRTAADTGSLILPPILTQHWPSQLLSDQLCHRFRIARLPALPIDLAMITQCYILALERGFVSNYVVHLLSLKFGRQPTAHV